MRILAHLLSGFLAFTGIAAVLVSMPLGFLMNALFVLTLLAMPAIAIHRLVAAIRERLVRGFWRNPFTAASRPYLPAALLRIGTWILVGVTVRFAIVPEQFDPTTFATMKWMIWGPVIVLCVLAFFPHQKTRLAPLLFHAALSIIVVSQFFLLSRKPDLTNAVTIAPPLTGEWLVLQGGDTPLLNHHYFAGSQRFAIDLIKPEDGPLLGSPLEEYAAFGAPILSPVNGTIITAERNLPDLAAGESDTDNLAGNYVVIEPTAQPGAYILIAHLQKDSVIVSEGDTVSAGDHLANCGNSGNTTQPHIHLQAMTHPEFESPKAKPLPLLFHAAPPTPSNRPLQRHDRVIGN